MEQLCMVQETFKPGVPNLISSDSPTNFFSAYFEDDGDTGYFYAIDRSRSSGSILDTLHIYNVANVKDRERPSILVIHWSGDGTKCALLVNGYAHAAFDFAARRGYCRNNFPNFVPEDPNRWHTADHTWSDAAVAWLS